MNEQIQLQPHRFPRITVIGTGLLVLAGILLPVGVRTLHDWFRLDPAYPLVLSMAFFMLAFAWWVVWIVTQRRWRWRGTLIALALLLAVPLGGLILFRPVLGGDLELVGWEWRFADRSIQFQTIASPSGGANRLSVSTRWDFPEFLGVQRRGVVSGVELNPDWATHQPELLWKIKVGDGWSGVAAVNRCLVTLEQRGDQECVTCYSLDDSELLWIYSHTARHEDSMGMGKVGPRSTPTIFDGHVFAMGATGILVCLDGTDGTLVWKRDICDLLGITRKSGVNLRGFRYEEEPTLSWGRAASPLIVGDLVIVPGGGNVDGPETTLLALDRRSGDEIWRDGDEMIAYGSPSLATIGGVPQVLLVGES
ncbi:MAG TPA: PQQ-binding-like beta-propeller repeat protein, partial [Pirellulaceae bacterium]|nr:PQQ-binding-like beta-propeller repeat protein [Pirellulaceae bacterium]